MIADEPDFVHDLALGEMNRRNAELRAEVKALRVRVGVLEADLRHYSDMARIIAALEAEIADLRKGLGYLADREWHLNLGLDTAETGNVIAVARYWLRNAGKPEAEHTHEP